MQRTLTLASVFAIASCGGSHSNVNFANGEGSIHWQFDHVARPALEEGVESHHVSLEIREPTGARLIDTLITAYNCSEVQPQEPETRMHAHCWWSGSGADAQVFVTDADDDECALRTRTTQSDDGDPAHATPSAWTVLEEVPCPPRANIAPPPPPTPEPTPEVAPATEAAPVAAAPEPAPEVATPAPAPARRRARH